MAPSKGKRLFKVSDDEFARIYSAGDQDLKINAGNATRAYKALHPTVKDSTAAVEGSRMLNKPNVQASLEGYRQKIAHHAEGNIEFLGRLHKNRRAPYRERVTAAAYITDQALGKANQRHEVHSESVQITIDLSGGKAGPVPQAVLDKLRAKPKD